MARSSRSPTGAVTWCGTSKEALIGAAVAGFVIGGGIAAVGAHVPPPPLARLGGPGAAPPRWGRPGRALASRAYDASTYPHAWSCGWSSSRSPRRSRCTCCTCLRQPLGWLFLAIFIAVALSGPVEPPEPPDAARAGDPDRLRDTARDPAVDRRADRPAARHRGDEPRRATSRSTRRTSRTSSRTTSACASSTRSTTSGAAPVAGGEAARRAGRRGRACCRISGSASSTRSSRW